MENHSSHGQRSGSDQNRNFVSTFLQPQHSLLSEGENDTNFQEFLNIIRRRLPVIALVTTVVTVIMVSLEQHKKPEYESNFRLLVEPVNNEMKVLDLFKEPNLSQSSLDYASQIQVLKSSKLLDSIAKELRISYPDISYSSLISSLTVIQLGETKILEVRYRSNDPVKTKVVLDKIAQDYLSYSREKRQSKLRQGIQFVEQQLPSIQKRVNLLQKNLQLFRQKYDFMNPDSQGQQIDNQISTLSEQRQTLNQQLAQAHINLAHLQSKDGTLAALNDAAVYQQLIVQLRQLDTQIALESTRFQENNPTLQALRQKRTNFLSLLRQEEQRFLNVRLAQAMTEVRKLEVQSQELTKAEQQFEQKRKQLPVLAREYTEQQRKLQVTTDSLNRFLTTRETLQIQGAQTELGWQLIQAPTQPDKPVSSFDGKRSLLKGLLTGLASGLGISLLLEKLDKTYHNVDLLKEKIKLPLLGNIPFEKQIQTRRYRILKEKTLTGKLQHSLSGSFPGLATIPTQDYSSYSTKFLESLRVLCTNIQLLSSDHQIRSIIISSATPCDGKSTVAFHLAQIATAMGHRVLLVDANLRQPIIHSLSNLNNHWGLSNLISTNLPVTEVIQQLPSIGELSVLTAGPTPPDSTKLFSSQKIKRLMENFHSSFDLVIYDAPCIVGLADASLLAPYTDGMVLVARIDKTDCSTLKRALDSLKISRVNILGIVGNGQRSNFDSY